MVEIAVRRKAGVPWWAWLVALLAIIGLLWFWLGYGGRHTVLGATDATSSTGPAESLSRRLPAATDREAAAPAEPPVTETAAPRMPAPGGEAIADPDVYAATADKPSLAGRKAALTDVKVVRIVGPKTFIVASGNAELLVMVDKGLDHGVSSQGRIDVGKSLSLKGTFERLRQQEIDDISDNRFRDLTQPERETLGKIQIYLRATEFGRIG